MRNAVPHTPNTKVFLIFGKLFALPLQLKAMKLTGWWYQHKIGPAWFRAHLLQFTCRLYIAFFAARNVTPLPIVAAKFAQRFRDGRVQDDFFRPDGRRLSRPHLATFNQPEEWRSRTHLRRSIASATRRSSLISLGLS